MKHPLPLAAAAALALSMLGCGRSQPGPEAARAAGALCGGATIDPQRLFLQQLGSDRAIVKWRGNRDGGAEAEVLCYGTQPAALSASSATVATVTQTGHREALLTGLTPDTTYYYSVGGGPTAEAMHSFRTAPAAGRLPADGNIRIWIVGDAGTAGADQRAVRDGYKAWVASHGGEPADLFLMLGDNAYTEGTDAQHQAAVFDMYPDILATTGLWPTIGNHEMGSSGLSTATTTSAYVSASGAGSADVPPNSPMPYLNIHTLPANAESGGVPSGTEQYYSFDYGSVHVVSLDSQVSMRDAANRAAMKDWLVADLAANDADWTIVIFHHPPYTKGSHDSDNAMAGIDQPIFDMREQFTPVFEEHGVDLVYSGHSHSYERSYYLHGHTGLSGTFAPAVHAELNDAGQPASGEGAEAYGQVTRNGTDDKVVYTVAGSSGQATTTSPGYPHPAMFYSAIVLGSVVIDAGERALVARFIDANGGELDAFTIRR